MAARPNGFEQDESVSDSAHVAPARALLLLPALLAAAMVPFGGATSGREAATVIGSTTLAANNGTADLFGKNIPVFQGRAASGYQVSSTVAGTIVSWSFRSAGIAKGSHFVLRVMRPVDATTWRAVATSAAATVTSATGTDAVAGPFTAAIAVLPGDRIALQPTDDSYTPIETGTNGADGVRYFTSPLADGSAAALAPGAAADNGQIVPIQATVEPAATVLASTAAPAISGTAAVGQTLTCSSGGWAQKPDSLLYAWLRDGAPIPAATAASYLVATGDAGHELVCRVTATAGATSGRSLFPPQAVPAAVATGEHDRAARDRHGQAGLDGELRPGRLDGEPDTGVRMGLAEVHAVHAVPGASRQPGVRGHEEPACANRASFPSMMTITIGKGRTLAVPDLPATGGRLACIVSAIGSGGSQSTTQGVVSSRLAQMETAPPSLELGLDHRLHGPSITRNVGSGGTNTCQAGLWSHYPTFAYAWYRLGARATKVALGTLPLLGRGQSLKLTPANEGMDIECVVTATNPAGSAKLASNHYVVPPGAPHPLQQPFVDVRTESPNAAPGLVGPEGASVVAEKIHLQCLGGHWDRKDITVKTAWYAVDPNGALGAAPFVAGDRLDLDMSPGNPQLAAGFVCVVTATTSHGVSGTSRSGLFSLWNGCIETRGPDVVSIGSYASPYGLGLAAGAAATIATGGLAGLILGGGGVWGYGPAPFGYGAGYGSGDRIVYTIGPNCLDYQHWLEKQGYTVKQRDS